MQKRIVVLCLAFFVVQLGILTDSSQAQTTCYIDLGVGGYACYSQFRACLNAGGSVAVCSGLLSLCTAALVNDFGTCLDELQPEPDPFEFARCTNACQDEFDDCINNGCPFNDCFDMKVGCYMMCEEAYGNGF